MSWFGQTLHCPSCNSTFRFASVTSGESSDVARVLVDTPDAEGRRVSTPLATDRPPKAESIPKKLGRYLPTRRLGRGGFGVVYLATDPELQREVAIKLPTIGRMASGGGSHQGIRARFQKEAQSVARLRHPNIVAVFDHGQTKSGVYIVYEFVPGQTLEERILDGELSRSDAIDLVATLADALAYAASEDIVHRDMKPANIMIDVHGRPQIMDFGLAVALQDGRAMTEGRIAGTPSYMSPEQAAGEAHIGPAADQYSLCAILYELVTGKRSVNSSGMTAVAEVANRAGPPTAPLAGVPADLRAIILRGMQKDPSKRYRDCRGFADDLRAHLTGHPVAARPVAWPTRVTKWASRNVATAMALAATACLLVLVAAVSTIAAITLQQRGADLAVALIDAQIARNTAEEQKELAQQQKLEAERQKEQAEQQKVLALANQKRAEDALAREIVEREKREAAESLASEETERRKEAYRAATVARTELEGVSEAKRALQYSEWLNQAAAEIGRGDYSMARTTLNLCREQDRGWEWRWLERNAFADQELRKPNRIPLEMQERLQPPRVLAGRPGFITYDANVKRAQAPAEWTNPLDVVISKDRRLGVFIRKQAIPSKTTRSETTYLRYLRTLNMDGGTFQDVCEGVDPDHGLRLLGNGRHAAIVTQRTVPVKVPNQKPQTVRMAEVWSLGTTPARLLEKSISDWTPTFAVSRDNRYLFGALTPSSLETWSIAGGPVLHAAKLGFTLANGPQAISLLPDGRFAMIEVEGRVHFIDPATGESQSGEKWDEGIDLNHEWIWDSSGRFLGIFAPGDLVVDKAGAGEVQPLPSRRWHIIDAAFSRLHCSLPMPMSRPKNIVVTEKRSKTEVKLAKVLSSALAIKCLVVDQAGATIGIRDAHGGLTCWQRESNLAGEVLEISNTIDFRLASRDEDLLVVSNENELFTFDMSASGSRPKKLFRRLGGRLATLSVHRRSNRVVSVNVNGDVALFDRGRQSWQTSVPGASVICFAEHGNTLFVGTEDGALIALNCSDGTVQSRQAGHASSIQAIQSLDALGMVATVGVDRSLRFWDALTAQRIDVPELLVAGPVTKLLFAKQQLIVFTQSSVEVFDCSPHHLRRRHSSTLLHKVFHACLIDDGRRILACDDFNGSILDSATGRTIYSLPRLREEVSTVYSRGGDPCILTSTGVERCLRTNTSL
ncbi:MAG: protein kinase [Planctomycetota bacterium]